LIALQSAGCSYLICHFLYCLCLLYQAVMLLASGNGANLEQIAKIANITSFGMALNVLQAACLLEKTALSNSALSPRAVAVAESVVGRGTSS
jgi:hypothetical protein